MSIELKIKLKYLAAESRIIRKEEKLAFKSGDYAKGTELYLHRIKVVRKSARHTHLAYAMIRGKAYRDVERTTRELHYSVDRKEVAKMLSKYGNGSEYPDVWDWMKGEVVQNQEAA